MHVTDSCVEIILFWTDWKSRTSAHEQHAHPCLSTCIEVEAEVVDRGVVLAVAPNQKCVTTAGKLAISLMIARKSGHKVKLVKRSTKLEPNTEDVSTAEEWDTFLRIV